LGAGAGTGAGAGAGAGAGGEAREDGAEYLHVDGARREIGASIILRASGPAVGVGRSLAGRRNRPKKTGRERRIPDGSAQRRWGVVAEFFYIYF
jgi:hypothetical protein